MQKNNQIRKKISICTLNGYFNYGNRLQLFALAKTLSSLGYEVSNYWPKRLKDKVKELITYYTPLRYRQIKSNKLRVFSRKNTPKTKSATEYISVYGSDQVWNPDYLKTRSYLLGGNSKKELSYAASIGTSVITEEQADAFRNALVHFEHISVREQTAKELLQPLTDKKIEVVLDPTLLLSRQEYLGIEEKPTDISKDKKYILCYILGDREYEAAINSFAKQNDLDVILFSDKKDSSYGIGEFLYLIHHAELICTDSFHACVFSFIFERPFIAFKRTGKSNYMYTRLQNLIETFGLENREFNGKEITKENLEVDYTEAKKILKKERKKSLNFLKKALDIKDEK